MNTNFFAKQQPDSSMITRATCRDIDFVRECAQPFERFGAYENMMLDMLRRQADQNGANEPAFGYKFYICCNEQGQQQGFMVAEYVPTICKIHAIAVSLQHRKAGVASRLLQCAIERCRELGITQLESITAETQNMPALSFFERHQFVNHGHVGYYPNQQRAVKLLRSL